jgi:adenylate cyclase
MAWVAATGDGAFMLAGIWLTLTNTGLPSSYIILFPPLWLAPVALSFGALRFSPGLEIYLIVLLATGLVATALLGGDWAFGLTETQADIAGEFLSVPSGVIRLAMLCLAGLVLVIAVVRSRSLMTRAISETLRGANLTRYLPRQIADRLAETGLEELRRGKRQNVAVLFTDIRSFTELSETLPPEDLSAFVTEFRSRLAHAADACGGTIDKFIGDAAMIVFGITASSGNDAGAALQCADSILREMDDWSLQRSASGQPAVRVGVGIHYGEAFCGAIGDESRLEYTILGDTVNVAARLEELTKSVGMPIVVSENVLERAGIDPAAPGWTVIETTQLRGRKSGIRIMASPGRRA